MVSQITSTSTCTHCNDRVLLAGSAKQSGVCATWKLPFSHLWLIVIALNQCQSPLVHCWPHQHPSCSDYTTAPLHFNLLFFPPHNHLFHPLLFFLCLSCWITLRTLAIQDQLFTCLCSKQAGNVSGWSWKWFVEGPVHIQRAAWANSSAAVFLFQTMKSTEMGITTVCVFAYACLDMLLFPLKPF